MPRKPTFTHIRILPLDWTSMEELHNTIAEAVGEDGVYPNSRRNLRKDHRSPSETPGGDSDDVTSPRPPRR